MSEIPSDDAPTGRQAFAVLDQKEWLSELSWYLMVLGFVSILVAGLCFYLVRIQYHDFFINATALGRYLLFGGITAYAVGRGITYYRRFRK